uniref:Uncharacterized protein n=1 Tax=Glossina palpalis gambiensis TaxID=67801 RepID=A0A1B0C624_9MUSC
MVAYIEVAAQIMLKKFRSQSAAVVLVLTYDTVTDPLAVYLTAAFGKTFVEGDESGGSTHLLAVLPEFLIGLAPQPGYSKESISKKFSISSTFPDLLDGEICEVASFTSARWSEDKCLPIFSSLSSLV